MKRVWFALAALAVITARLPAQRLVCHPPECKFPDSGRPGGGSRRSRAARSRALTTMEQLQEQWDRQATLMGSLIRHAEIDEAEQDAGPGAGMSAHRSAGHILPGKRLAAQHTAADG